MDQMAELRVAAEAVLEANKHGDYTVPAAGLYPHQWLWDSCFIAIGLRHVDIDRAMMELKSLCRGQWANGMLPNIVLSTTSSAARDGNIWRSSVNPNAPSDVPTSGITQPPMLAEAVVQIGKKLSLPERRSWYKSMYPVLVAYHQWLYTERDPHGEGLTLQIHPWETGLDNTPPWMQELHEHQLAWWITAVKKLHFKGFINLFRRDLHYVPGEERLDTIDALAFYSTQRRLRRKNYDIDRILRHSLFAIEDVNFNAILIRANTHLQTIAKTIHAELPETLQDSMAKATIAFEGLWDPYSNNYYSREFVTHRLLKNPTIGTLLPLYGGSISKERAALLVKKLEDEKQFGLAYPAPSVPANSDWFNPIGYWQGPTWVNTNWLIINGLEQYGYKDHAAALREATLELVSKSGFSEYFNPLNGTPAGVANFSWTAALTIDLLSK